MKLNDTQIQANLQQLKGWTLEADGCAIAKAWTFPNFEAAHNLKTALRYLRSHALAQLNSNLERCALATQSLLYKHDRLRGKRSFCVWFLKKVSRPPR